MVHDSAVNRCPIQAFSFQVGRPGRLAPARSITCVMDHVLGPVDPRGITCLMLDA